MTVHPGGTLSPGGSAAVHNTVGIGGIGTLNTGPLKLTQRAAFTLEISTSELTSDLVASSGSLDLIATNDVVLTISDLSPAAIGSGSFVFVTYNGTWNGGLFSYNNAALPDDSLITVQGNQYRLDYNFNGNSVALIAVPEPGTVLSVLGGLGALVGLQRFRQRG